MYVSSLLPLRPPRGPLADPRSPLTPARPAALLCAAAQAATHCERQVEVGGGRGCSCPPAGQQEPRHRVKLRSTAAARPRPHSCPVCFARSGLSRAELYSLEDHGVDHQCTHARLSVPPSGGATARRHQHEMYSYDLGTAERAWCLQTSPFFFRSHLN